MSTTPHDTLTRLHAGLTGRRRVEDVAADIVSLQLTLPARTRAELHRLARAADRSSMPTTYRTHPGVARARDAAGAAMAVAGQACPAALVPPAPSDAADPHALHAWCALALEALGMDPDPVPLETARSTSSSWWGSTRGARGVAGGHAVVTERLDASARRGALPGLSARRYRRAVRAVTHLQFRASVLAGERAVEYATAVGKARMAGRIPLEQFVASPKTAAFTAYYVARLGARTVFTVGEQVRPMDAVAESLLKVALTDPHVQPAVIAAVLTRGSVLSRLSESERGQLLGTYWDTLVVLAGHMHQLRESGAVTTDRVATKGQNSSAWNALSRAFNQTRTGWLNVTASLGVDELAQACLPGKAQALIAGDVAAMHHVHGDGAHEDATVAAALPAPWQVVLGLAECTAEQVRAACTAAGLDPDASGWTSPYRQAHTEEATFTLELVHGVTVTSPDLAALLRRTGVFSGYGVDHAALEDGLDDLIATHAPARTVV